MAGSNPFKGFAVEGATAPGSAPGSIAELADALLAQLATGRPVELSEAAHERIAANVEAERVAAEARRRAERDARRTRELAALPPKARAALVAGEYQEASWPATVAAVRWLSGPSRALLLRGGVGVGKTAAAAVAASRVVEAYLLEPNRPSRLAVSWMRSNDLVSAILHSYAEDAPELGERLVVVDDAGLDSKPDFETALCQFLDDYDQRLVMTTNLTKADFRARFGDRVCDRLCEVGQAFTIPGESRRKRNGDF